MKESTRINKRLEEFIDAVCAETDHALEKHPEDNALVSVPMAAGTTLVREVFEVMDEISWELEDLDNYKTELAQVAAVALMMYTRACEIEMERGE